MTKNALVAILLSSISLVSCVEMATSTAGNIPNETTTIQRKVFTPSGDWGGSIDYIYGQDGALRHATYDFSTFNGYDKVTGEFSSIRCVRKYDVSKAGNLILKSTVTTDLATGKTVRERTFYEPKITHWMTIAEAHKGTKAEQHVSGGNGG